VRCARCAEIKNVPSNRHHDVPFRLMHRPRPLSSDRNAARVSPERRDGVEGGGTQTQGVSITGETLFGPAEVFPVV